ncbi:hypothetical protein Desmer_2026 [Desulfosporosinus meridiei DSM 13257]|uniref:Uncharacterized protein n=1 Tax=Desulfosporosinus meridiei (strain ATCC BAA-275 / DSM 13257 / KCTC 12902 / NCIMB 13706 / S10) TaxID=768704 RepID=J7IQ43_DESMD|nr:hypothetical protein Desmer_2026 [Desulfosporosinus meridiei DSM 13257]
MKFNPIKFGLYGGISFALILTILHYISDRRLGFLWLFGGVAWFLVSVFIGQFLREK